MYDGLNDLISHEGWLEWCTGVSFNTRRRISLLDRNQFPNT